MKINVFYVDTVTPRDEEEAETFCDILNMPSLKYGTAQFVGRFSHWITKSELRKMNKIQQRYYDPLIECWRDGFLLLDMDKKYFAQFGSKL